MNLTQELFTAGFFVSTYIARYSSKALEASNCAEQLLRWYSTPVPATGPNNFECLTALAVTSGALFSSGFTVVKAWHYDGQVSPAPLDVDKSSCNSGLSGSKLDYGVTYVSTEL